MANILLAWELGAGIGHITRLQPMAQQLIQRGHRVFIAARNIVPCFEFLRSLGVPVIPAPADVDPPLREASADTYAGVLFNSGFSESRRVMARVAAWRHLYDFIHPNFIVADCSPTALLAAHCSDIQCVAIGTGFECPPDVSPLPSLRRQTRHSASNETDASAVEGLVLEYINGVCRTFRAEPFERVSQIYHGKNAPLLLTFPELDCYPERESGRYWGPIVFSNGERPIWPEGQGPRVFAYVIDHAFTTTMLGLLAERGWPTLVVGRGKSVADAQGWLTPAVKIATGPLDSQLVADQCDLTICYAGHGTICMTLLAGKPLLTLPTTVEQYLNGVAVSGLSAGEMGDVHNPQQVATVLERVAMHAHYKQAAEEFAAKYAMRNSQLTTEQVTQHLESILPARAT